MLDHPIILLIVVAAALLRWLSQKAQAGKDDSQRPQTSGQAIPRSDTQTEEERVRRFLEALGQPAGSTPPPKMAPKRETQPRAFSTLPPLTTVPPPLPPLTPLPPSAVQAPPRPSIPRRVFTPAIVQEAGFEVRDLGAQAASEALPAKGRRTVAEQQGFLSKLASREGLRSAIVLREIFGPPRSLQPLDPISGF